jgi:hypothetical protein
VPRARAVTDSASGTPRIHASALWRLLPVKVRRVRALTARDYATSSRRPSINVTCARIVTQVDGSGESLPRGATSSLLIEHIQTGHYLSRGRHSLSLTPFGVGGRASCRWSLVSREASTEVLAASGAIQVPPASPPSGFPPDRNQPPAVTCVAVRGRRLAALIDQTTSWDELTS